MDHIPKLVHIFIFLACFMPQSRSHNPALMKANLFGSSRFLSLVPRGGGSNGASTQKQVKVKGKRKDDSENSRPSKKSLEAQYRTSVWVKIVHRLKSMLSSLLKSNLPSSNRKTSSQKYVSFAENMRQYIDECEIQGNTIEKRKLFVEGSFSACLNKARLDGKPLLVALVPSHSQVSKRAMIDRHTDSVLKKEGIKIWGTFPRGKDASAVRSLIKVFSKSEPTFALIRPRQNDGSFQLLGKFPPSRGIVPTTDVSGRRLSAWVASTVQRFRQELDQDVKYASDRSIEREVKSNFEEALVVDITEQAREQQIQEAQARAKAKAQELLEATAKRRQDILAAMPVEPGTNEDVVTVAVRLPNGERVSRRFVPTSSTKQLFDWLDAFHHLEVNPGTCLKTADGSFSCKYGSHSQQQLCEVWPLERRVLLVIEYQSPQG